MLQYPSYWLIPFLWARLRSWVRDESWLMSQPFFCLCGALYWYRTVRVLNLDWIQTERSLKERHFLPRSICPSIWNRLEAYSTVRLENNLIAAITGKWSPAIRYGRSHIIQFIFTCVPLSNQKHILPPELAVVFLPKSSRAKTKEGKRKRRPRDHPLRLSVSGMT